MRKVSSYANDARWAAPPAMDTGSSTSHGLAIAEYVIATCSPRAPTLNGRSLECMREGDPQHEHVQRGKQIVVGKNADGIGRRARTLLLVVLGAETDFVGLMNRQRI